MATDPEPVSHAAKRADALRLDWLEKEADRLRDQNTLLKRRIATQAREITNLERFRAMLAEQEPEGARDAAVSMAARATLKLDRAASAIKLERQISTDLRRKAAETLETLGDALKRLGAPDCRECLGECDVTVEVDGYGSIADETPPTHLERVECEECSGLGLDWSAASAGGES